MKFTRRHFAAAAVSVIAVGLAACNGNQNGNQAEARQQLADTQSLENNQPLPHYNFSQERQNMKDIEDAEATNVQTTSFVMQNGDRDPVFSCPSIGFGIPDSASLSNPLQVANPSDRSSTAIGQMDPTGIYAPVSSEGTFTICLTANGSPYISRFEGTVNAIGGPAEWDPAAHMIRMTGAPTAAARVAPPAHAAKK